MNGPRWWFFGTHPKSGAVTILAEAHPKLGESHARVLGHLLADDTKMRLQIHAPKGKAPLVNPTLGNHVAYPRWIIYEPAAGYLLATLSGLLSGGQVRQVAKNVATWLGYPVELREEFHGGKSNPSSDQPIYDGQIWHNFQTNAYVKVLNSDDRIVVFRDQDTGQRERETPKEFRWTHTLVTGRLPNPKRHKGGPLTLAQVARELTAHHLRTAAGFYGMGGRWFGARVRAGRLQVWDFDAWRDVPAGTSFHDHNGQPILTVPGEANPKRHNARKPSMLEAGYEFVRNDGRGVIIVSEIVSGGLERWVANKGHASFGFHYRGTDWEFASSKVDNPSRSYTARVARSTGRSKRSSIQRQAAAKYRAMTTRSNPRGAGPWKFTGRGRRSGSKVVITVEREAIPGTPIQASSRGGYGQLHYATTTDASLQGVGIVLILRGSELEGWAVLPQANKESALREYRAMTARSNPRPGIKMQRGYQGTIWRSRAAHALDMTNYPGIADRGPKTLTARNRVAAWLDANVWTPTKSPSGQITKDIAHLESMAAVSPRAHALDATMRRQANPKGRKAAPRKETFRETEARYEDWISRAAENWASIANRRAMSGIFGRLYLYVRPSTATQDGALYWLTEDEKPDPLWQLATAEGFGSNLTQAQVRAKVWDVARRLPLYAYGSVSNPQSNPKGRIGRRLSKAQALTIARNTFGPDALVDKRGQRFAVYAGRTSVQGVWNILGVGRSWDEALEDANRPAGMPHQIMHNPRARTWRVIDAAGRQFWQGEATDEGEALFMAERSAAGQADPPDPWLALQSNPSYRVSGTIEEIPDAPQVARRGPGRPRKVRVAPVELAPPLDPVPFEVPAEAPGRELQAGDRVTVPYSGRASYFGRAVKHTRESGIFEGYTYETGERLAFVRINRGHSVETHAFPVGQVRLHGKSFAEQAAGRRAGRPAKLARLTWKAHGSLAKAEAMLEKATAEHAATESLALELYPQHEAQPGRPRGRTAPPSREYVNARAKLRRLRERVDLLESVVRSLGGRQEYGQATGTDPWAANRRRRYSNPTRHIHGPLKNARTVRGAKRKRNPRGSERERAVKTFRMWHEFAPHKITRMKGPDRLIPRTLVKLGDIRSIDYISDKYEGRPVTYTHKTDRPRPVLATDPDGQNLHIIGGRVRITGDGLIH